LQRAGADDAKAARFHEQDHAARIDNVRARVLQHFAVGRFEREHGVDPLGIDVVEVMRQRVAEFVDRKQQITHFVLFITLYIAPENQYRSAQSLSNGI